MTSVLNVDTIADKAGTGPVSLTKQSAAKMFHTFNGTGTVSTYSSFNVSSLTDEGTGDYTTTFSNAFSSNDFANNANNNYYGYGELQSKSTTTVRNRVRGNGTYTTLVDTSIIDIINHGDLA